MPLDRDWPPLRCFTHSIIFSRKTASHGCAAARMLIHHLEGSVLHKNAADRTKCHHAATIAGLAFGNAFLGINHSLAHQLGAQFHLPHGLCCALTMTSVMEYNSSLRPTRMGVFSNYTHPMARSLYAQLARQVGACSTEDEDGVCVQNLIDLIEQMKDRLNVPKTILEAGVTREEFMDKLEDMAVAAFDDQCTGTNPRYPLISELKAILRKSCLGETDEEIQGVLQ